MVPAVTTPQAWEGGGAWATDGARDAHPSPVHAREEARDLGGVAGTARALGDFVHHEVEGLPRGNAEGPARGAGKAGPGVAQVALADVRGVEGPQVGRPEDVGAASGGQAHADAGGNPAGVRERVL